MLVGSRSRTNLVAVYYLLVMVCADKQARIFARERDLPMISGVIRLVSFLASPSLQRKQFGRTGWQQVSAHEVLRLFKRVIQPDDQPPADTRNLLAKMTAFIFSEVELRW